MEQSGTGGFKQLMVQWLDLGILGPWIILLCLGGAAVLVRQEMSREIETTPRELMLSVAHPLEQSKKELMNLEALGVLYVQCVAKKNPLEKSFIKRERMAKTIEGADQVRSGFIPIGLCSKELEDLGAIQLKKMGDGQWALFSKNEPKSLGSDWVGLWLSAIYSEVEKIKPPERAVSVQEQSVQSLKEDPNIQIRIKSSQYLKEDR